MVTTTKQKPKFALISIVVIAIVLFIGFKAIIPSPNGREKSGRYLKLTLESTIYPVDFTLSTSLGLGEHFAIVEKYVKELRIRKNEPAIIEISGKITPFRQTRKGDKIRCSIEDEITGEEAPPMTKSLLQGKETHVYCVWVERPIG